MILICSHKCKNDLCKYNIIHIPPDGTQVQLVDMSMGRECPYGRKDNVKTDLGYNPYQE